LSDERPEALLRSALEKIVYFEARSEQVQRDLESSRAQVETLQRDLAGAAQREIELRRELAELQVSNARAHREREETARVNEALRQERAALIGKLVESSRIHESDRPPDGEQHIDLAGFIAELRSEALARQGAPAKPAPAPPPPAAAPPAVVVSAVARHAQRLQAEGRLSVTDGQLSELSARAGFPGRTEETLFGFSVRELSSPDSAARVRAAERLRSLGTPAAAPALATALHGEAEPAVQVALLSSLAALGNRETASMVSPHLASPDPEVRIAALKALLVLEPHQVAPHLAAAMKDPERTVRRRASLLALGLSGEAALAVGEQAISDADADVRGLAARVLGAGGGERARGLLQSLLRDADIKVRRGAAEGLSRILGADVSAVAALDDVQLRREVRRLAALPSNPVHLQAPPARPEREVEVRTAALEQLAEALPEAAPAVPEDLCSALTVEVRAAIRGRTLAELVQMTRASSEAVNSACELLVARGELVRRGQKYFTA
jgi:HEAT repeat protein